MFIPIEALLLITFMIGMAVGAFLGVMLKEVS